jgi:hypothetical protein
MKLTINRLKEFDAGHLISHTYLIMKQDFPNALARRCPLSHLLEQQAVLLEGGNGDETADALPVDVSFPLSVGDEK